MENLNLKSFKNMWDSKDTPYIVKPTGQIVEVGVSSAKYCVYRKNGHYKCHASDLTSAILQYEEGDFIAEILQGITKEYGNSVIPNLEDYLVSGLSDGQFSQYLNSWGKRCFIEITVDLANYIVKKYKTKTYFKDCVFVQISGIETDYGHCFTRSYGKAYFIGVLRRDDAERHENYKPQIDTIISSAIGIPKNDIVASIFDGRESKSVLVEEIREVLKETKSCYPEIKLLKKKLHTLLNKA